MSKITPEDISRMMVGRDFVEKKLIKQKLNAARWFWKSMTCPTAMEERLSLHDVSFAVRSGRFWALQA